MKRLGEILLRIVEALAIAVLSDLLRRLADHLLDEEEDE